ncbi:potential E3 ubiquitin-protein ligase ariadne-2-like [Oncorhynchus mykiss]|uniref:RING-type domain-containing protein n=1 Tax=Oncorhynchus mykiss TaxID=8022 RepID=A0A8K9XKJ1_ONCMY|nr:potential E3 ubiquitin-protein ligase ariadne-2-like [Oncorhynchus mykiss]
MGNSKTTQCQKKEKQEKEKCYDPGDKTLKFVNRDDDIIGGVIYESLRAEMSCGHAVTPESLTGWCLSLLDKKKCTFICPASREDGEMCGAEWSYTEVRKLALLTPEEMKKFEETMADLVSAQNSYKSCPGCNSYVARTDLSNLRVHCTVCSAEKGQLYEFCWLCLQQWKGSQQSSDHCDNDDCMTDLELLKTCPTVTFADVQGVTGCPSTRACPTCGVLLEHDKTGCKNIECKNCNKEFCFVCLKLTSECLKTSKYFIGCSAGVAPRQTSIPSWSDK